MRTLLLSSLIILYGCSQKIADSFAQTVVNNSCLVNVKPKFETVLFNTQVDITSHHLTGLLLMKKMQDDTTRVVFTNEMGIKYFDFEFTENNFRVISCIRKLNKKIAINQLKKIFSLILMNKTEINSYQLIKTGTTKYFCLNGEKEQTYYITDTNCTKVMLIETTDGEKKKIIISFDGQKNGIAEDIFINYKTFKFDIHLKQIER
ncbi:MAG: hypothetical protein JWN78_3158 [Bacteroidota bacterium]|nr:hypothetical protein [Bacteroidota bacterium]